MDEKRKRMGARGWTVLSLALLVGYPLSYGPACALGAGGNPPAFLHPIYVPLEFIALRCEPLFYLLVAWVSLWTKVYLP